MSRGLWEELEPKWPRAYWDDWLREPPQRKGRQVIRPEVSRTYHFGVRGTSSGQYSIFLEKIKLNDQPVAFDQMDLSYLEGDRYYPACFAPFGGERRREGRVTIHAEDNA